MVEPKKVVTLQDIYDGYAKKAKSSGKDTEVDIVTKTKVRFTDDFGQFKKGHTQDVSRVMLDYYTANGVVEVVKEKE